MKNPRPQSNNHRHAYLCKDKSVKETRLALEKALSHHDMLRTLAIHYDASTPLHVVLRPSSTWFQHCITILDEPIDTAADLKRLLWNDPQYDFAAYPGPMFRAVVTYVQEENCAGLVYMIQHSVFDGISLEFFLQDLDALLVANNNTATTSSSSSSLLPQRIPFRAWIESEFHFRTSLAAQTSVQWHVNRLRGIHSHHAALFPRQKAPEWFKGDSTGWIDESTGKPGPERKLASSEEKENQEKQQEGVTGLSQTISLPDMQHLKHTHGIDASTVMKAALALLNTKLTGHKVALFAEYFAARNSWPHLPEWMSRVLPEPMEVDGPTVQKVVVAIDVPLTGGAGEEGEGEGEDGNSVLEFLIKLQKEQDLMKGYVHAPFRDVIDGLYDTNNATTNTTTNNSNNTTNERNADAKTTLSISRRQIFNWLPPSSSPSSHHHLSKIQQISRTDCGLLWNFLQLPPTSPNTKNHTTNSSDDENENGVKILIMPSWDDAQLTCREVSSWMEELGNLAERISKRENWGRDLRGL